MLNPVVAANCVIAKWNQVSVFAIALQFCTGLFVAKSIHHVFSFLGKGPKLEKNKLDSGGLRDCLLCRTHTHLCCLYKQRLRRLTDLTTIHRKLRGLTVSPGNLWSRWESAMTATLSCSPQCTNSCRLQMYIPWQNKDMHTKRRAKNCCNDASHFNFWAIFVCLEIFDQGEQ